MPDCHRCDRGLEERAGHAFFHCPLVRPFSDHVGEMTARMDPEHLVSIDLAYVCDNVLLHWSGDTVGVSDAASLTRMVM